MKVRVPNNFKQPYNGYYLKAGDVFEVESIDNMGYFHTKTGGLFCSLKHCAHLNGMDWVLIKETNRQRLRTFLDQNKANKQRLSLALGKSKSWLSTMCYESKREDIADETLTNIMGMLTIDWQSTSPLYVATAGYVPYTTIPANYSRPQDKQRLLGAFFNGDVKK